MSQVVAFPSRLRSTDKAQVRYCDYEGYRLAYEEHGAPAAPPVFLIHGILLDSACNRDLAQTLASRGYRVILLDLLGHGRSDKPGHAKELRVDFFAEQLRTLMDHLGVDKAVIGGVSLGAITSLTFATQHPERVKALFLEMPVMERATPAAALMLVPEGWAWIVEDTVWRDGSSDREGIGACVWNCSEKPPIRRAETPPLALCIACLRAIEHDQNAS